MMLLSVLSPVLRCEWMLTEWQVALVTTVRASILTLFFCVCITVYYTLWCHNTAHLVYFVGCIYWHVFRFEYLGFVFGPLWA